MRKYKFIALIFILQFVSCKPKDPFYTRKGGWDTERIPLIKPYECMTTDYENWFIHCPDGSCTNYINKINILDGIIIGKYDWVSANKKRYCVNRHNSWLIIIPNKRMVVKFSSEDKFNDSLSSVTNMKPIFKDIDEVYKQFCDSDYLDWFPDNYNDFYIKF